MNYIANSKNRKLKNSIGSFVRNLHFSSQSLGSSSKLTLSGATILWFGLGYPWFRIEYEMPMVWNAFSFNAGYAGYMVALLICVLLFVVFSAKKKELLRSKMNFPFYDHTTIFFVGFASMLITIVSMNAIQSYVTFFQKIEMDKGPIVSLVGAVFVMIWGIVEYRDRKRFLLKTMYVDNIPGMSENLLDEYKEILERETNDSKNMSLPI